MGLNYLNLDAQTRGHMVVEIDSDIADGSIYLSSNLSSLGRTGYPGLLRTAATAGSDESLAAAIRPLLNSHGTPRLLPSGAFSKAPDMRVDAHEVMAEGEFSRFYMRGLCLRAIAQGIPALTVFRAKAVTRVRPESEAKIGTQVSATALLDDLRSRKGIETTLGVPGGPGSGLCVRLP